MDHPINLYQTVFNVLQVPFCMIEKQKILVSFPPLNPPLYANSFVKVCLMDLEIQKREILTPLVIDLSPGYSLGIVKLDCQSYLIFGPVVTDYFSLSELEYYLNSPLYRDNKESLKQVLFRMPPKKMIEFNNAFKLTIYLCSHSWLASDVEQFSGNDILTHAVNSNYTDYVFHIQEESKFHTAYEYEHSITLAIEKGNMEALLDAFSQPIIGKLGHLSESSDRQARYHFVTSSAIVSRAAIRGGMDAEDAYSLADTYCRQMDQIKSQKQIDQLNAAMMMDFCQRVADLKSVGFHTEIVRKCCDYIRKNLHQRISLDQLSKVCKLSNRRLSAKFKAEMGIGIIEYIHELKLEEAAYLLRYSDFSVSEISNYLGYCSQSYFSMQFQKIYHKTPWIFRQAEKVDCL